MDILTVFLFALYMIVTGIVRMSIDDIRKNVNRIENILKESNK